MCSRDIVAYNIPRWLKVSAIAAKFEQYGEIMRIGIDEKNRKSIANITVFISFDSAVSATRALNAGIIMVEGNRVEIVQSDKPVDRRNTTTHHPPPKIRKRNINGHVLG